MVCDSVCPFAYNHLSSWSQWTYGHDQFGQDTHPMGSGRPPWAAGEYIIPHHVHWQSSCLILFKLCLHWMVFANSLLSIGQCSMINEHAFGTELKKSVKPSHGHQHSIHIFSWPWKTMQIECCHELSLKVREHSFIIRGGMGWNSWKFTIFSWPPVSWAKIFRRPRSHSYVFFFVDILDIQ